MKTLEEIVKPYKDQLSKIDYKNIDNGNLNPDTFLFQKWAYRVPKDWYGFSLGNVPFVWALIIDDFLKEIEKECPDFEIHQIKLKYGGLRFHLNLNSKDDKIINKINTEIYKLEELLFNYDLIY